MPNSTEHSAMDSKTKSWFGNIYDKVEALLLETEETMRKDTVKFVESQVQTVGESVKKFYSKVMEDLHPEPYEIGKNTKANLKEQPRCIDIKLEEDTQVINGKNNLGGVHEGQIFRIESKNICNHISDTNMPECDTSTDDGANKTLVDESSGDKQEDSERTSSLARGCNYEEAAMETSDHLPVISTPVVSGSTDAASSDTTSSLESSRLLVEDFARTSSFDGLSSGSSERSENRNSDVVKTFDAIEEEVEIVEPIDEQQLEETCVWVEGDKFRFSQQPVKHKSYKKKIQEAFSSKKRSTREYEHLTAQREDQPLNQEAEENVAMKSNLKLSASVFPDSDWELV